MGSLLSDSVLVYYVSAARLFVVANVHSRFHGDSAENRVLNEASSRISHLQDYWMNGCNYFEADFSP